jgi:SAM-dependent methyltransferase
VLLNHLLDLEEEESVFLAEECLQDLLDLPVTAAILEFGLDADACIEMQGLGQALHLSQPAEFWLLLTDKYSTHKILEGYIKRLRAKDCRTVRVEESDFFRALTEYFSRSMAEELFCESCAVAGAPLYVKERIERLKAFLEPIIPQDKSILEIGCGSGMATQALLRLGYHPLSMDSDRCDLCQALKSSRMDPMSCFVLDARLLPCFFPSQSFQVVLGFMMGLINDFNWAHWRDILLKASFLAKERILFTVYTQKEAELIAKALGEAGWKDEVIDNRDSKGIYDQWAYLGRREG